MLLPQRLAAIVTGVLGAVGLVLATVGLYGVMAYSAGRRTREIAIRMALGARRSTIMGMMIREGCSSPAQASSSGCCSPALSRA